MKARITEQARRAVIVVGVLGLVACLTSCGGSEARTRASAAQRCDLSPAVCESLANAEAVVSIAQKAKESATPAAKKEVHLCGAPTKGGGACKRHVRREGLHCWMHGGPSGAELDAEDAAKK